VTGAGQRVVMFLYRTFELDSRVEREACTLVGEGYQVEVMALPGEGLPEREWRDGYSIRRLLPRTALTAALQRFAAGRGLGALRRLAFRGWALTTLRSWARLAASAAAERPVALLIGHDLDGLMAGATAKRRLRAPLIYDAHELYPDMAARERPKRELRGWILYESRLIRHADLVFAVTPSRAKVMVERYGIETPTLLRNVPEVAEAEPAAAPVELRKELGLQRGTRLLLYLGGLQPVRGLEQAIVALQQIPDAALVLMGIGEDAYVESLRALAARHGVSARLLVRPPVRPHQVVAVAAQADLGLVLNLRVGLNNYLSLPNKIFETIAAGVPVVASDFPDMAELIRRYAVGETCDPEDPAAIARAVRAVLDDPERRRRLAANAERAAAELNWERESQVFLSAVRVLALR
jgi:glycosyltransferase involved in cell wall biosynthesis